MKLKHRIAKVRDLTEGCYFIFNDNLYEFINKVSIYRSHLCKYHGVRAYKYTDSTGYLDIGAGCIAITTRICTDKDILIIEGE